MCMACNFCGYCVPDGDGLGAVLRELQHVRSRLMVAVKADKVVLAPHRDTTPSQAQTLLPRAGFQAADGSWRCGTDDAFSSRVARLATQARATGQTPRACSVRANPTSPAGACRWGACCCSCRARSRPSRLSDCENPPLCNSPRCTPLECVATWY